MNSMILFSLIFASAMLIPAHSAPPVDATAQMVVTIEAADIRNAITPTAADIVVSQGSEGRQITKLVPLSDTSIEIFVLVDDRSDFNAGSRADELRSFLLSQPSSTLIGSAYIRDGRLDVLRRPTPDRMQVIDSLTPPKGCQPASPFVSLGDLINSWEQTNSRRVILMISDGIDPDIKPGYYSASAEAALETAQGAGVIVYAIYHPSLHYAENTHASAYSGQVLLAHVAQETGGQAYFSGLGPELSIAPYLSDIGKRLANQYSIEFVADWRGAGRLQAVTVKSANAVFDIMAPYKVWVPASNTQSVPLQLKK